MNNGEFIDGLCKDLRKLSGQYKRLAFNMDELIDGINAARAKENLQLLEILIENAGNAIMRLTKKEDES